MFDIQSGKTHYYDPNEGEFLPLVEDGGEPLPRRRGDATTP